MKHITAIMYGFTCFLLTSLHSDVGKAILGGVIGGLSWYCGMHIIPGVAYLLKRRKHHD